MVAAALVVTCTATRLREERRGCLIALHMGSFRKISDLCDLLIEWTVVPGIELADTHNKADILLRRIKPRLVLDLCRYLSSSTQTDCCVRSSVFTTCQIYDHSGDKMVGLWARAVVHPDGEKNAQMNLGEHKKRFS